MSNKPPKNIADEAQVKADLQKHKNKLETAKADMEMLLKLPQFRRFIWWLLGDCGIYRTSFTGNNSETYFLEGARNIGLKIQAKMMDADADAFHEMIKENRKGEMENV